MGIERQFKQEARIENWELVHHGARLIGEVYGHPHHANGKRVRTSRIIQSQRRGDYIVAVETENTIYFLGKEKNS